jgi:hypothetical protein
MIYEIAAFAWVDGPTPTPTHPRATAESAPAIPAATGNTYSDRQLADDKED